MKTNWDKETDRLREEELESVKGESPSIKQTVKTSIKMPAKKKRKKSTKKTTKKTPSLQSVTGTTKKDAPTIIITYKDKKTGKDISKVYTCKSIRLLQNTETSIEDSDTNTTRKDVVDITIDAQVIDISV